MYMNDKHPSIQDIKAAIRHGVRNRNFIPAHIGSALKNKGIQPLIDSAIDYLPDPSEVENFAIRISYFSSQIISDGEKVKLDSSRSADSPAVALAFKLESVHYGQLTYIRMYQGQIVKSDILLNTRTNKPIRAPRLVLIHAKEMKEAQALTAGDIGAFFGLDCNSGDTFVHNKSEPLSLESMFVPDPVMSLSVEAKSADDMMKLAKAFSRFQKEDPTFRIHSDPETREIIMSGMGELHLEIYTQRLNLEYDIQVNVGKPKVSYRETLRSIERFDYLHKRQTGGRGQYAHIIGRIEPLPSEQYDFIEFVDETSGMAIPKNYIPYIQKV
ncbi:hypothetical protein MXB_5193 [Myxobolus squamalis]|nr:hypothetical protein MXB_5193 [Myxobolus squamalis]